MYPRLDTGIIYSITCIATNKSYIGQAKDYKYKDNKPYKYGLNGRWSDHVSSAKCINTPIGKAIKEYGPDKFIVTLLLRREIYKLDGLEAATIKHNKTIYPNGYNVMRHSRVKNREKSNIHEFFLARTKEIEVKPIKRDGTNRLVYVYLKTSDNPERIRLIFGQGRNSTFETATKEAMEFVKMFQDKNIPIKIYPGIFRDDPLSKYHDKILQLLSKPIDKIRITTMGNLIAVYVSHSDIKSWKEQIRVTFGGKHVSEKNSYEIAKLFTDRIGGPTTKIVESQNLQFLKSATGSCKSSY